MTRITLTPRPTNILDEVMPGYRAPESIVAYIIRNRNEERARREARARRIRLALTIAHLIGWPAAAWLTVRSVELASQLGLL